MISTVHVTHRSTVLYMQCVNDLCLFLSFIVDCPRSVVRIGLSYNLFMALNRLLHGDVPLRSCSSTALAACDYCIYYGITAVMSLVVG